MSEALILFSIFAIFQTHVNYAKVSNPSRNVRGIYLFTYIQSLLAFTTAQYGFSEFYFYAEYVGCSSGNLALSICIFILASEIFLFCGVSSVKIFANEKVNNLIKKSIRITLQTAQPSKKSLSFVANKIAFSSIFLVLVLMNLRSYCWFI